MLSRVANSIYWMCRYIERAENVARFISVNTNLLLDMPSEEGKHWEPLIMVTGDQELFEKKYGDYTGEAVVRYLTFEKEYSNSIISCLAAARENARSVREIISAKMWEHINNFYLELMNPRALPFALNEPDRFFEMIQMRCALFTGLIESTMSHGEAYNFGLMGMMTERADKTSRILDVKYFMLLPNASMINTTIDSVQWMAVLKSASAFQMFRRQHHRITPRLVADFLIFDDDFPRSIRHCLQRADDCLHRITGTSPGTGTCQPEKLLGRLKANMEYDDIDDVLEHGMHEYLDDFQTKLNAVDNAIGTTFFNIKPMQENSSQQQ